MRWYSYKHQLLVSNDTEKLTSLNRSAIMKDIKQWFHIGKRGEYEYIKTREKTMR